MCFEIAKYEIKLGHLYDELGTLREFYASLYSARPLFPLLFEPCMLQQLHPDVLQNAINTDETFAKRMTYSLGCNPQMKYSLLNRLGAVLSCVVVLGLKLQNSFQIYISTVVFKSGVSPISF